MLDKFLSLFRRQVKSSVVEGAAAGLSEADIQARVKSAVTAGVGSHRGPGRIHRSATQRTFGARRGRGKFRGARRRCFCLPLTWAAAGSGCWRGSFRPKPMSL